MFFVFNIALKKSRSYKCHCQPDENPDYANFLAAYESFGYFKHLLSLSKFIKIKAEKNA